MIRKRPESRCAGWTLLEVIIAFALLAVLAGKAVILLGAAGAPAGEAPSAMILETQANHVLDQIALAFMGSDRETLVPQSLSPVHVTNLRYSVSLGVVDGVTVWAEPEEVSLSGLDQVVWRESPDTETERRVVWTKLVQPFLEGEIPNGFDDNGNGLIDEEGLNFVVERNKVTIRLTLARRMSDGVWLRKTVQTSVTCRNNPQ